MFEGRDAENSFFDFVGKKHKQPVCLGTGHGCQMSVPGGTRSIHANAGVKCCVSASLMKVMWSSE